MNFAKNFKWQLLLAALGFSFMLTARVNAQEIVNTDFSTPSTSVSGNFNTPTRADLNTAAAVNSQSVYTPANAIASRANNEAQQLNALSLPREAGMFTAAIAVLLLCCAAMKKVAANRRKEARRSWNSSPVRA
jgi:hypothetical protein